MKTLMLIEKNQRLLVNIIVVFSGFLLLLGRKSSGLTAPFLWAEDGRIFLEQLLNTGPNLFTQYAGQYWLLERILYLIASFFPLKFIPQISYTLSTFAIVALVSVVLQRRNQALFGKHIYQIITFYLLISLPGVFEATNGIISVYLWLPVSLGIVLSAPQARTWWGVTSEFIFVFIASFTSLTAIFVLPIAIWSVWKQRTLLAWTKLMILFIGAMAAVYSIKQSGRPSNIPDDLFEVFHVAMRKVFGVLFFGHENILFFWPAGAFGPFFFLSTIALVVTISIAIALRKGPFIVFLFAAGISSVLGIVASPKLEILIADPVVGGRYFVPAIGFVILTVMAGVSSDKLLLKMSALILLTSFSFGFASDFTVMSPNPLDSPLWIDFVNCVSENEPYCHVDIAPAAPWGVTVEPR